MAQITLDNLTKRFGSLRAVDNISLRIDDGEFLVLVGPSGCGKTTTLRMVAGLEQVSSGKIWIGDRRVDRLAPKDRDLAMVFQSYALYSHFTVRGNFEFALKAQKVPKPDIARRIERTAEMLDLTDLLDRKPKQMSGGQRQRVALGRAIVREPSAFLMDEPLSNLDAMLRLQTRKELIELTSRLGSTVVYVTHDQVEAMTMGHRLAVMRDGLVEQLASPREVYDHPATRFVAEFIGSPPMRFAVLEVTEGRDGPLLAADGVRLPAPPDSGLSTGDRALVGLRPENLRVVDDGSEHISGHVSVIETLGADLLVHVDVGDHPHRTELSVLTPADSELRHGETVRLAADPTRLHLFDPASGNRINQTPATSTLG